MDFTPIITDTDPAAIELQRQLWDDEARGRALLEKREAERRAQAQRVAEVRELEWVI